MSRCISSSSSVLLLSLWKSSLSCSCSLSSQSARLAEAAAWRRRARRRQTGGSGGAAGGCGRQPAPAAVKTTQFCVSLKLSLLLRSASLFCCNSPQLWLCWAGRGGSADATLLRSAWSSGHKMDGGAPSSQRGTSSSVVAVSAACFRIWRPALVTPAAAAALCHILLIVRVLARRRLSPDTRDFCPVGGFW